MPVELHRRDTSRRETPALAAGDQPERVGAPDHRDAAAGAMTAAMLGTRRHGVSSKAGQQPTTPWLAAAPPERPPHVVVAFLDGAADLLKQQRLAQHQLLHVFAIDLQRPSPRRRRRHPRSPARGSAPLSRGSLRRPGCVRAPSRRPRPRRSTDPTVDDEGHALGYLTLELNGLVGAVAGDTGVGQQFLMVGVAEPQRRSRRCAATSPPVPAMAKSSSTPSRRSSARRAAYQTHRRNVALAAATVGGGAQRNRRLVLACAGRHASTATAPGRSVRQRGRDPRQQSAHVIGWIARVERGDHRDRVLARRSAQVGERRSRPASSSG